jgi:ribosomal protein S6--L-glutamate ligase
MVRIGIVSTRSKRYHPNRRLLEAGRTLGHAPFLLAPRDVLPAALRESRSPGKGGELPEVILPRIGSTIEDGELAAIFHLERSGIPAVNGFTALTVARDKFLSLRHLDAQGIPVPRTFLVTAPGQISRAVRRLGGFPVVMKAPRGRQGTEVYLVDERAFARYILEHPSHPTCGVLVQEYVPSAACGDVRVMIVAGEAVAAMRRIPKRGDFRSNAHLRGKGVPWEPDDEWVRLALRASAALGLQVAGVDLLEGTNGPLVLEVNTTPGFRELERVTRVDVAIEIIRHAVKVAGGR